jgi:PAS domain S-box-containing protein
METLDNLLLEVVDKTMEQVFTETGIKVIYDFLENNSHLKREEIAKKPKIFSTGMKKLLGSGAPVIEKMILKDLYSKLELRLEEKDGYEFSDHIKELRKRLKGFDEGGLEMKEYVEMDKKLRDLIEIIQFTENVSAKTHGKKNEADIYRTVKEEFGKSKSYNASILLLTDDGTKLGIAETSITRRALKAGEKASGLRLKGYKIDLNKSSIYSQVVKEGKTVQVDAGEVIHELVPQPLAHLISKITGYEKRPTILTPLKTHGIIIGTLAISSTTLAKLFIPSVKNLAQHISTALELADERIERKKAEEALRKSGEKFRKIFENANDCMLYLDKSGRILEVNRKAMEVFGGSKKELLGKHFAKVGVISPRDMPNVLTAFSEGLAGKPVTLEVRIKSKEGQEISLEGSAALTKIDDEVVTVVIARDVTQRKMVEEALKQSEKKLREIIDTSPDAIVWTDTTGKITLVNSKGSELTGFSKKELVGKNFMDVGALTQESKEKILESFMKRIDGIDTPPYEVEVIAKNGEIIQAELSASPIYEGDKIVGTQSIFRDLRERKKMEEKLKEYSEHLEEMVQKRTEELLESEKRYSVLVEEARDGVAIIQDAKFVFTNNRLAEIVGYSRDELIGMSFLKLADEEYRQLVKERYERRLRGEEIPATYEAAAITKDGKRVPIELSATHIDYQGRPADLVIVRDIEERKRMEMERLKLERLAAIGKVATMVGHDLRNPLQSIENAIYYLNNELPNHSPPITIPQKVIDMLQIISNSVNYADKIVRDLHDFSGTKKPVMKKTDINAVVEETLSQLKAPKKVKVTTELGHLPEIEADKEMIKRIFMNVALNAIQAIEKRGKLEVLTKETKGFVEVSFKDTGVGMSKENMKKLFTPFFTTKAKGMGMGLAICKRFVDAHSGSIKIKSKEGKGSTFTIKLPIQQDNGGEKR